MEHKSFKQYQKIALLFRNFSREEKFAIPKMRKSYETKIRCNLREETVCGRHFSRTFFSLCLHIYEILAFLKGYTINLFLQSTKLGVGSTKSSPLIKYIHNNKKYILYILLLVLLIIA